MQLTTKLPWDLAQTRWASILNPLIKNVGTPGQILATNTNDDADNGNLGQYISKKTPMTAMSNAGVFVSGSYFNIASIPIESGNWLLTANIQIQRNGSTFTSTDFEIGIGTTPNSFLGVVDGDTNSNCIALAPTTFTHFSTSIPAFLVQVPPNSNITYYLIAYIATYTAGAPKYGGRITAWRPR